MQILIAVMLATYAEKIKSKFEIKNDENCKIESSNCFVKVPCLNRCYSNSDKWANCFAKTNILSCKCENKQMSNDECLCQQEEIFVCDCSTNSKSENLTCVTEHASNCSQGYFETGYYGCQKISDCTEEERDDCNLVQTSNCFAFEYSDCNCCHLEDDCQYGTHLCSDQTIDCETLRFYRCAVRPSVSTTVKPTTKGIEDIVYDILGDSISDIISNGESDEEISSGDKPTVEKEPLLIDIYHVILLYPNTSMPFVTNIDWDRNIGIHNQQITYYILVYSIIQKFIESVFWDLPGKIGRCSQSISESKEIQKANGTNKLKKSASLTRAHIIMI